MRRGWPRSATGWLAGLGAVMVTGYIVAAVFATTLSPHPPDERTGPPLDRPSTAHPLGTNDVGEDLLSELLHGARVPLTVGIASATMATLLGGGVGLLAGSGHRRVDAVLMRSVDLALIVPFVPLLIVVATYVGRGIVAQTVVIGALLWAAPARVIRSQVLSTRQHRYVRTTATFGASRWHVLHRHLLPAVAPLMVLEFIRAVQIAVLLESTLSFLGLGDPSRESWGSMLYYATARGAFLTGAWKWWIVPPGLAIAGLAAAFGLAGLTIEEGADPRLKTQMRRMTV